MRTSALRQLRKLRVAKGAAEGFNEQEAFDFVTDKLRDANNLILSLREWKDKLGVTPELEEDEVAPSDDEGKEEFGAFVEEFLGKARDCREFILSSLWNLWGMEEAEVEAPIEDEESVEEEPMEEEDLDEDLGE